MSQNLISLQLSDDDVRTLNTLMGDVESRLTGLLALDNATRRQLTKMGDKSEAFVRQTIMVLGQNPEIVPPSLGLAEAQADLRALDQLRPLLARMQRLDISKFHPDPVAQYERIESERNAAFTKGRNKHRTL